MVPPRRRGRSRPLRRAAGPAVLVAAAAACSGGDVLTVAVPSVGAAEERVAEAFERERRGAAVHWVEVGEGAPTPDDGVDVWWGGDAFAMTAAERESRLAPLPAPLRAGGAGAWLPVERIVPVLAFNTDSVPPGMAPRDIRQLFHQRWRGRVLVPEPPSSALGRALVGWAMDSERARTGDEEAGLDWLRRIDASIVAYVPESRLVRELASGRGAVAVATLSAMAEAREAGLPVDFFAMEGGVPGTVRGIALLPGAQAELGTAFMAVAAGEVGRAALLDERRVPAAGDRPGWVRAAERRLRVAPLRPDSIAPHLDEWLTRWRVEARGRGERTVTTTTRE